MPTLPILGPVDLWAPDPSVSSAENVIEVLPRRYRTPGAALAAMAGGLAAHMAAHDEAAEYAAAQSDILRATERYLDGLADDRGQIRGANELDEQFRARVISWHDVATRVAVLASVRSVLSLVSDGEPVLFEPSLDGYFVDDGTSVWSSHVWDSAGGTGPSYPDRHYGTREATALLDAIPALEGFTDRCFGLILPAISSDAQQLAWADDGAVGMCFSGDGSEAVEFTFSSAFYMTSDEAYQAIANAIESVRAHGVRWFLLDDSRV